jgi:ParB-like chromosome segregation protein Spo0J
LLSTNPQVSKVPLVALQPADWNPRLIKEERFQNLCASIKADPDFLWRRPVLAQADGTIYAGNMRYRAAQHLGFETIPAIIEDIPDQLARERALRDNAQWGEWQEDELAELLYRLREEGSDVSLLGFEERELQKLLDSLDKAPSFADADDVPALVRRHDKPGGRGEAHGWRTGGLFVDGPTLWRRLRGRDEQGADHQK